MISPQIADILFGRGSLAVSLVRTSGEILYENELARNQLCRKDRATGSSIIPVFTVPSFWLELIDRLACGQSVSDEPVILQTDQSETDIRYLTAFPELDSSGVPDLILCVWSARKNALAMIEKNDAGDPSGYTRDLESLLEHRTYQHLLITEQNHRAQEILNILPEGILVASPDGTILYINYAMTDVFGLRPASCLKPSIRYALRPDLVEVFDQVAQSGRRHWLQSVDPAQLPAGIDFLPLLTLGKVDRIVLHFSRLYDPVKEPSESQVNP